MTGGFAGIFPLSLESMGLKPGDEEKSAVLAAALREYRTALTVAVREMETEPDSAYPIWTAARNFIQALKRTALGVSEFEARAEDALEQALCLTVEEEEVWGFAGMSFGRREFEAIVHSARLREAHVFAGLLKEGAVGDALTHFLLAKTALERAGLDTGGDAAWHIAGLEGGLFELFKRLNDAGADMEAVERIQRAAGRMDRPPEPAEPS